MAKREFKPLTWKVKNYNCNADKIEDYDVLKYREDFIKKLKKKCATKEEFAEAMQREMMYYFWSKAECELIIEISDNKIWLIPWCGCREPEVVKVCVTDDDGFDWSGFAEHHIGKQIYKNRAKIDIYDQLQWRWDEFIDFCWCTRLKYERDDPKFHRQYEDTQTCEKFSLKIKTLNLDKLKDRMVQGPSTEEALKDVVPFFEEEAVEHLDNV